MPVLPVVSGKDGIKYLESRDAFFKRAAGSHRIFHRYVDDKKYVIVVPDHKEIKRGTMKSILSQAQLDGEDFCEFFK